MKPAHPDRLLAALLAITAVLATAALLDTTVAAAQAAAEPLRRVRTANRQIAGLMDAGYRKSPTFRHLIDALQRSDVIVYVNEVPHVPAPDLGMLQFVCQRGRHRYLRVSIRARLSPRDFVVTVAHELQHALEIAADAGVVDSESMAELYRRIGRPSCNGYETAAARRTGDLVSGELER